MQLIQQARLETVGRLAAGVAHEVKNPLAIIQFGVDFLANELKGNPVQYETVMDMEDAVQRADSVIKGLLDFSRSEQLDLKEADIRKVIDDSLLLVRHELNSRHVTVEWIKDEHLPLMMLDKNKLKQVFINLLMNAMHAMPEGGTVHISASLHRLTAEEISLFSGDSQAAGENSVIIRIADTGTGISDDAASRLFDPFFTTKPVGVGTGLGLSVTRKILELHNATIILQNRSDCKGAEARLLFKI
jgi:signal transduction histidine kinase